MKGKQSPVVSSSSSASLSKQSFWLYLWAGDFMATVFNNLQAAGWCKQNQENPASQNKHCVWFQKPRAYFPQVSSSLLDVTWEGRKSLLKCPKRYKQFNNSFSLTKNLPKISRHKWGFRKKTKEAIASEIEQETSSTFWMNPFFCCLPNWNYRKSETWSDTGVTGPSLRVTVI